MYKKITCKTDVNPSRCDDSQDWFTKSLEDKQKPISNRNIFQKWE